MAADGADAMPEELGPGGHAARWAALGAALLIVPLLILLGTRETGDRSASSALIGELVPPIQLETIDGEVYDIDDHRGEWVVVNFFASWCAPCRVEHPELVALDESGAASVVSIAFDDDVDDARRFFDELGGDWPVITGGTGAVAIDFGVTAVPETYLVAPDGTVVAKWISAVTADGIVSVIDEFSQPQAAP